MNLLQSLAGVYDSQSSRAGAKREDTDAVLLPLFHTYLTAHITVTIDMQGNFLDACVLDIRKDEVYTIVPSTVESASRSGPEPPPNPLNDKLVYLMSDAGSYIQDKQMILDTRTATFVEDGTKAVSEKDGTNLVFTFPDNWNALPKVVEMQVSGMDVLEGNSYVNNNVPGYEFG